MNLIFWFLKVIFRFPNLRQLMINPLHPHISMHILYTVHYTNSYGTDKENLMGNQELL